MAESKQYITQNQENGTVQISEDVIISIVTVSVPPLAPSEVAASRKAASQSL